MSAQLQLVRPPAGSEHDSHLARAVHSGRVSAVRRPSTRLLAQALPFVDWSDAYAVGIPAGARQADPQEWADAIFRSSPSLAVRVLFGARELLVRGVGIERGTRRVFDTVARTEHEVLLGVDQAHLGFRASVLVEPDRVVLSTVVGLHNRRGRVYFALVRRLHPLVVRGMLARAAKKMAGSTDTGAALLRSTTGGPHGD
jgi:hypothetical protein